MSKKPGTKQPKYRLHKSSGQAIVTLVDAVTGRRRDHLLGQYDTRESRAKYHALIGKWETQDRRLASPEDRPEQSVGGVSVRALANAYKAHIKPLISVTHFTDIERSLGLLCDQYGDTSAARLGPRKLKETRNVMIGLGWRRATINKRIRLIIAAVRWAASEELVKADVHTALATIPNLKRGERGIGESEKVLPAPEAHINAVREHLPRQVVAMLDLQLLTGMRPGEVVIMRRRDIDTSGKVWSYTPAHHKTQHHGHSREVMLGPKAIEVLRPYVRGLRLDGYLFDPRQANAEQAARDATTRRRKNQKANPRKTDRTIGEHYDVGSYRRAVQRACLKAKVPQWSPNQLRHNAATTMRSAHGLEAAAMLLGHSSAVVTERHYAERDRKAMEAIVGKTG